MSTFLSANVERFAGFADCYDAFRPQPPAIVPELLCRLAGVERPALVVDLGSGTGLSTRIWAGRAGQAIGIEPSADMRRQAEESTTPEQAAAGVSYQDGLSSATGLADACADIVTCSQSLHWMEPGPTFAEAARILRPGGLFAAYDCDWPPAMPWPAMDAYLTFAGQMRELEQQRGVYDAVRRWEKEGHLQRMRESGHFRFTRELTAHHVEMGSAERLVGLAMSQGGYQALRKLGLSDDETGLSALRAAAAETLGSSPAPWHFSYRVRIGVR